MAANPVYDVFIKIWFMVTISVWQNPGEAGLWLGLGVRENQGYKFQMLGFELKDLLQHSLKLVKTS